MGARRRKEGIDGWRDGWRNEYMSGWRDGQMLMKRCMDRLMDGGTYGLGDRRREEGIGGCMDRRMEGIRCGKDRGDKVWVHEGGKKGLMDA